MFTYQSHFYPCIYPFKTQWSCFPSKQAKNDKVAIANLFNLENYFLLSNVSHLQPIAMYLIHSDIIANNHTDQHCRQELNLVLTS